MNNIDKKALREAAEKAGSDEWCAFIDTKSKTYSVHTPGDNRCGDVVKWAGFDGQQQAAAKARFIAAASPATVLALLDEIDELQELRRSYLALRGENEDLQAQVFEAENQAEAAARELQEHQKADSEPVMYVMGMGEALDAETASTCKGAVDSWVGEWNQERLPGQADYKTVPLYRHAQPVAPEIIPDALRDEIIDLCSGYEIGDLGAQEIWEACRSVMFSSTKKDKAND